MAQQGVIPTNLPSFPWEIGDKLDAVPLNNILFQLQAQLTNLQGQINALGQDNLNFAMTTNWGGGSNVTAGPYMLMGVAPFRFTVIAADFTVGTAGGSFVFSLFNNGVAIDGLTSVNVFQFATTHQIATGSTVVEKGSSLLLTIDSVIGLPTNAWISINGITSQLPEQVLGVCFGSAAGTSNAVAFGTFTSLGEGLFNVAGISAVNFFGMGAANGVAFTGGVATGDAHGVASLAGGRTANASGTSTALAQGQFTTGFPTLVLDDPTIGVLNQNPLG